MHGKTLPAGVGVEQISASSGLALLLLALGIRLMLNGTWNLRKRKGLGANIAGQSSAQQCEAMRCDANAMRCCVVLDEVRLAMAHGALGKVPRIASWRASSHQPLTTELLAGFHIHHSFYKQSPLAALELNLLSRRKEENDPHEMSFRAS